MIFEHMILSSFTYKESGWELDGLSPLGPVNLLVAKNATGKTRTIRALRNVSFFLQMKKHPSVASSFETNMTFVDPEEPGWIMSYGFKLSSGVVEREILAVNGHTLIKRTAAAAKYESTRINPPSDKLVVQIRRDKNLYPDIERLMIWAEGVISVSCSDIIPLTVFISNYTNPYSFADLVDSLTASEIKEVLSRAKNLGYGISSIKTIDASQGNKFVQLKERFIQSEMLDIQLSGGMLRTLYILCLLPVIKHNSRMSLLLIDDLGEGLDYHRSADLGKLLFGDCEKNRLQLIASSNDAILMDVVDIANWQVLRRKGSKVESINQSTCRDLFDNFRMTGLSNFDLFSSDFIDNFLSRGE